MKFGAKRQPIRIVVFLLCAVVISSLPTSAICDPNQWSLVGLENEWIQTLCIPRNHPNIMIAGGFGTGIFRSTDSGVTWDTVALQGEWIWKLVQPEGESQAVYAATDDGLYRSYDLGATWILVTRFGLYPWIQECSVAVDPQDPLHILWGTGGPEGGGLSASYDGGISWRSLSFDSFIGISYHPHDPERCYAWNINVCWQSLDSGDSWDVWLYPESGPFYDVMPSNVSNRIWVSCDSLMWTDDFGESWSRALVDGAGNLNNLVQGIVRDSDIALGAAVGVYLIPNPFGEWELLNSVIPEYECWLLSRLSDPPTLFASFVWGNGLWSYTIEPNSVQDRISSPVPSYEIYPNPFNSSLNMMLPMGEWDISIFNILGQRIENFNHNSLHNAALRVLDLSSLASGVYFIRLQPLFAVNHSNPSMIKICKIN
jgi:hypothetical protein